VQDGVAGRVAMARVDGLETIQIDQRQRQRKTIAPRASDLGVQLAQEGVAVGSR